MTDEKIVKLCWRLVKLMDKTTDDNLPKEIANVVKLHSKLAIGSALIPIPGVDIAAGAATIWGMYIRINNKLGLSFSENVIKTIGSGVATNLASYVAMTGAASLLKFIPIGGTIGGAILQAASLYGVTLASGYVYLKALCALAEKDGISISEDKLKGAVDDVLLDKDEIKDIIKEAKSEYKQK